MNKSICLVGNPNCGKTTLFNVLTGSYQKVGNWSGVTVDKKQGKYKKDKSVTVTDLPGIYSLSPLSLDEKVVTNYLKELKDEVIINVLDGTNLKRNLFLTIKLLKLKLPMIVAINMADELEKEGIKINVKALSRILGVPVFLISAKEKKGILELINSATMLTQNTKSYAYIEENKIHSFIEKNIINILEKESARKKEKTEKIDKILTHRVYGFIIFFIVMFLVYFLSLKVGGYIGDKIGELIDAFGEITSKNLYKLGVNQVSVSMISNGVIKGVGSVLSFLPHLIIMFFLMTALEESGYASRVALIFDKLFSSLSLSGKSVIPFVLSFGCTVAGIEGAKTIESTKERRLAIILSPFLPCGAKSAVFGWFSHVFFNGSALIALSLYLLSILVLIAVAKVYTFFNKEQESSTFILELPILRIPRLKETSSVLLVKIKEFLIKTGTIILAVSIGVWILSNFGFKGYTNGETVGSFLYYIGNGIKYIFYPLGFSSWQASVSLISGIFAKEAVAESMEILSLYPETLFSNGFSVYAFMAFTLLSPPCLASLFASAKGLNDKKLFRKMLLMEFLIAYFIAFIINSIGFLISLDKGLLLSVFVGIIGLTIFIASIKVAIKKRCNGVCAFCKGVNCGKKNNVRLYERSR